MSSNSDVKAFVERVESLEKEKRGLAEDIRSVYGEAGDKGLNVKALRKVVALRKQNEQERVSFQDAVDVYMHAVADTPLEVAIRRAEAAE